MKNSLRNVHVKYGCDDSITLPKKKRFEKFKKNF